MTTNVTTEADDSRDDSRDDTDVHGEAFKDDLGELLQTYTDEGMEPIRLAFTLIAEGENIKRLTERLVAEKLKAEHGYTGTVVINADD